MTARRVRVNRNHLRRALSSLLRRVVTQPMPKVPRRLAGTRYQLHTPPAVLARCVAPVGVCVYSAECRARQSGFPPLEPRL